MYVYMQNFRCQWFAEVSHKLFIIYVHFLSIFSFLRFEIAADDNSIPIVGGTPDVCHSLLLQKVNNFLSINLVPIKPNGNAFFGLTHPTVLNLVQSSTGARKCSNYRWNKFEVAKNGDSYIEDTDFTLNYESLQRSIELHNYKMDEFYNSQKAKFI